MNQDYNKIFLFISLHFQTVLGASAMLLTTINPMKHAKVGIRLSKTGIVPIAIIKMSDSTVNHGSPNCVKCGDKCHCIGEGCNEIICRNCIEKEQFNNKWNKSSPPEKLTVYGIKKLKILAKNKKIKGFSKYKKKELIDLLTPLVNEKDFPIKPTF